jgi:hypothetical protein
MSYQQIDDANPERALRDFGIRLPGLPSDDQQVTFTGRSGRSNMEQACIWDFQNNKSGKSWTSAPTGVASPGYFCATPPPKT